MVLRNLPSGAKARIDSRQLTARLKSCPFKTHFSRVQNLHAIALGVREFYSAADVAEEFSNAKKGAFLATGGFATELAAGAGFATGLGAGWGARSTLL